MDKIYRVTVEFAGKHSGLIETKIFYFTSKDAEVDFVSAVGHSTTETLVGRHELAAYGRGEFVLAINDLEKAKILPVHA